jgi:hypothetical protein
MHFFLSIQIPLSLLFLLSVLSHTHPSSPSPNNELRKRTIFHRDARFGPD